MLRPRLLPLAPLTVLLALVLAAPAQAGGRDRPELLVTLAARVCPAYTDITANRARNNIMESLRDLGEDTPYRAGEPIDPAVEARVQPRCTALPNWRFTLGRGYRSRAVTGPWGALSIVTNPFDRTLVSQDSTPLLDTQGRPTGAELPGATTFALSDAEAALAARPSSLWVQGGTTTDPVLDGPFPGQYGFGALRCAIDNLNGDNVEWISVPQGTRHVFCYAYYVKPPPTSGTIVIRKETQAPAGLSETFGFTGNVSYNAGGEFSLTVNDNRPAQQTFFRAATGVGDGPWEVRERVPDGWRLAKLDCRSQSGGSLATTDLGAGRSTIRLAAGDVVTCTYVDDFVPPKSGLLLRKVTYDGVGRFGFAIDPAGGGPTIHTSARTTEEGLSAETDPGPFRLDPGHYQLREDVPESVNGRWRPRGAQCATDNGPTLRRSEGAAGTIGVDLPPGLGTVCTFTNDFDPRGALSVSKVTRGGTATTGFVISPVGDPSTEYRQSVTTTREGEPAKARGDSTGDLPLGDYVIEETTPSGGSGAWKLTGVICNGLPVGFSDGRALVRLTRAAPTADCHFTDVLTPDVGPPPRPPDPKPDANPEADVAVGKRANRRTVVAGGLVTYTIMVINRGPQAAQSVVAQDVAAARGGDAVLRSLRTTRGRCATRPAIRCTLGTLRPRARVTITAVVRLGGRGGLRNRVAVSTSTFDPVLANNQHDARVAVRPAAAKRPAAGNGPVRFTG